MIGFDVFEMFFEGASHADFVGAKLLGFPAGINVDGEILRDITARRKSKGGFTTPRTEADEPIFLSGIKNGITDGEPIHVRIANTNVKKSDYNAFAVTPRPSHADYTALVKYGKDFDMSGSGPFSGRMTAPICVLGGIAKSYLKSRGISVFAYVSQLGNIKLKSYKDGDYSFGAFKSGYNDAFQCVGTERDEEVKQMLLSAQSEGDSVGGVIECVVSGLPVGLGGELDKGLEVKIASAVYTIPAVKGVEFGEGFGITGMNGSMANDGFYYDSNGKVRTYTNHAGGLNGGISNGMDVTLSVAIRPTPTIAKPQKTVNLLEKTNAVLEAKGRHDSCVALRASAPIESMVAIAISDELVAMDTQNG